MFSKLGERLFGDKKDAKEIKQFAEVVVNFSSQYGNSASKSYTAANLAGEPHIYNRYGDFQEALVLVKVRLILMSDVLKLCNLAILALAD